MRNVNKVIIIGNLTRDPEMRQTPNGQYITTFGIATNREWVTQEGEKNKSTEFHDVVAWSKLAEICSKYLKKGKLVYVEGYLKTRSWDTEEGVKKFKTEVVIEDMIMLDKQQNSGEQNLSGIETPEAESSEADESSTDEKKADEPSAESSTDELKADSKEEEPKPEPTPEEQPKEEENKEESTPSLDINEDLKL